jgi:hypothetical protein
MTTKQINRIRVKADKVTDFDVLLPLVIRFILLHKEFTPMDLMLSCGIGFKRAQEFINHFLSINIIACDAVKRHYKRSNVHILSPDSMYTKGIN